MSDLLVLLAVAALAAGLVAYGASGRRTAMPRTYPQDSTDPREHSSGYSATHHAGDDCGAGDASCD